MTQGPSNRYLLLAGPRLPHALSDAVVVHDPHSRRRPPEDHPQGRPVALGSTGHRQGHRRLLSTDPGCRPGCTYGMHTGCIRGAYGEMRTCACTESYGVRTTAGTGVVQGWWRWPRAGGGGPGLVSGPGLVQGWWGRGSSGCQIDTGQGHGQGGHRAKERAWSEEMRAPRLATCGMRHSVQARAHCA